MMRISEKHIKALRRAESVDQVQSALASAIQLELATIPVYLTGLFSLKQNANRQAAALVQSVVVEEMLHMTLVCNTLIAIGGRPEITAAGQGLYYPGPLPLNINDGLQVSLKALTPEQTESVFMAIEKPDYDGVLPGEDVAAAPASIPGEYASIGDFYKAIAEALARLVESGEPVFAEPKLDEQVDVSRWFPPITRLVRSESYDGKVSDLASAEAALGVIVVQGEGAQEGDGFTPIDSTDGAYAHYFKFGEIFHGKRLIENPSAPSGWSYAGEPVPLDEDMVFDLLPNAALSDYQSGTAAFFAAQQFYGSYMRLLGALDTVFHGEPEKLNDALGLMYEMKLVAQQVTRNPAGAAHPNRIAAPPFMLSHVQPKIGQEFN
ncbi:ferritin-like protein [Massilia sp. MB5]|uniref:ferritin-like domain-containing protein n=1 Tax=Massilia sp. MB5 TaxID=2919578 RepID=UPI001F0FDEB6|nr:ferritin-like protein [Massilia sp. MB5]UMR29644.1 ferritin-like protein [Massilia sp. MB5]